MRIAVISFTKAGSVLCGRMVEEFRRHGEICDGYVMPRYLDEAAGTKTAESVGDWTGRMFGHMDALIYIGAAGIAVRAIAPYLKDKMTDPAVLVCDEQADFVISLLSGHVGGANELAVRIAAMIGAVPVITTASDVRGLTAVDVWAKERDLVISDRNLAKRVAAALLDGEKVGFFSDYRLKDRIPEGYLDGNICRENVWVTCLENVRRQVHPVLPDGAEVLRLIPKCLTIGIGCRKNTEFQKVERAVRLAFARHNLDLRAVRQIASIDLKNEEEGICTLAGMLDVPFVTFSAEALDAVDGEFAESSFVRHVTGTGNVCERAALLAAGAGAQLWVKKEIYDGVTVAVASESIEIGAVQK